MTWKTYSDIQRQLGVIEGVVCGADGIIYDVVCGAVATINELLEKLASDDAHNNEFNYMSKIAACGGCGWRDEEEK